MNHDVIPDNWILPNRIGFNYDIYKKFNPEIYDKKRELKCKDDDLCKTVNLFNHQSIVKDYIQIDSPYRGILLYHMLGSGKSASAIAASEGYMNKKRIFVLSPASLATNFQGEILKISQIGLNLKKDWYLIKIDPTKEVLKLLLEKYAIDKSIIKKNNLVWIPIYEDDIPNAVIIKKIPDNDDKSLITETINHIIKNRYTFISYNGLNQKIVNTYKDSFTNSFVIIDEIHNFISRVISGSKTARQIYNYILSAKDTKVILLSGTPIINNPFEIATLINLIRGPMIIYQLSLLKTSILPPLQLILDNINKDTISSFIDEINIDNESRVISVSLLPKGYKKKDEGYLNIIKENWGISIDKVIENIIKILNNIKGVKISVKHTSQNYYALPNQKDEFNDVFIDNADEDNPKITNTDLFMRRILGTVSYFKSEDSKLFPTVLPEVIKYINMTNHQLINYSDVRKKERGMDNNKKNVMDDKTSVYRAFSRMVCNFAFPENIKRLYPHDIRKMLKKEIDVEEEVEKEDDDEEEDKKIKEPVVKADNEYENELKEAMTKLLKSDALEKDNLENLYSPKFAKMYEDIENSPGSVLVYSQFRSVEGLGIFTEILNKNGYKEIELKKSDKNYIFADSDIFNTKYDNKRYIIFNQDKEKTNILKNLFNGEYDLLPETLKDNLPTDNNQLYGKIVKIFCITASGAEGISLKNVRRVLITEPYWNNVRLNQVIGRAIRTGSHVNLPKKDQNVQVFKYIMKFTKEQMDADFTLKTLDKSKTTDEHIEEVAFKKENIINQFLNMLKSSSFDCIINSKQNKPLENGYKCYNWAIGVNNNELAFTNNYKDDYKIMQHKKYQVKKNNKGQVVSHKNKKYVIIDKKVYDYFSYINSGVLVPINLSEIK